MNDVVLGALITAIAFIGAGLVASWRQSISEHERWWREKKEQAYVGALDALTRFHIAIAFDPEGISRAIGDCGLQMAILPIFCSGQISRERAAEWAKTMNELLSFDRDKKTVVASEGFLEHLGKVRWEVTTAASRDLLLAKKRPTWWGELRHRPSLLP